MHARALSAALLASVFVSLAAACTSYEATDKPICGDKLIPDRHECVTWPTSCGCPSDQKCTRTTDAGVLHCAAAGPGGVDAPCTDDAECAKGTLCDGTRCRQSCFEVLDCGDDEAVTCTDWRDTNF